MLSNYCLLRCFDAILTFIFLAFFRNDPPYCKWESNTSEMSTSSYVFFIITGWAHFPHGICSIMFANQLMFYSWERIILSTGSEYYAINKEIDRKMEWTLVSGKTIMVCLMTLHVSKDVFYKFSFLWRYFISGWNMSARFIFMHMRGSYHSHRHNIGSKILTL